LQTEYGGGCGDEGCQIDVRRCRHVSRASAAAKTSLDATNPKH
jgi:hypothetical protein